MPKKVILDVDPGFDDAMALCIALFDPTIEVMAVTAVGGNCPPEHGTRNVQAIVEQLDPPRWPRIGAASAPDHPLPVDGRYQFGEDGLCGVNLEVAELRARHPSEKVISDALRADPNSVTLITLGPLTNVARVFQRDPDLTALVGELVMAGGTVSGPGNVTPAAEFNIFCDPESARAVFLSRTTKTLVPLDLTNQIVLSYDLFHRLPDASTAVGKLLQAILQPAFRAYRQRFGLEGIHVHDTIALLAAIHPELFATREMAVDVETLGELTRGATVFDRRRVPAWRHNIGVATSMEKEKVIEAIIEGLAQAARR